MMSPLKKEPALCPYCCIRPGTTNDHLIPRCLFPNRIPNGIYLPTVKACLGDVFACVYWLGSHETYDTAWLMGFYDQFCIVVRTGMDLTAPQTSPPAVEKALWAVSDLSVIPRPDQNPRAQCRTGK